MSIRIQELAVSKGISVPPCDICGKKATTKCENCLVTHYCSEEHKSIDAKAFHPSVCKLLWELKTEKPVPFSEADRIAEKNNLKNKKKTIFELAIATTRKWIFDRKPEFSYPSALIALNMAKDIWSDDAIEVIFPMCLVSEVFLELNESKIAADYMIIACWISQKYVTIPTLIMSQLNRLKGLVNMSLQNWVKAREAFAECVYATATEYNMADIRMATPFGYLGLSLLQLNDLEGAMSSFHRMADKWLECLLTQYGNKTLRKATESEMKDDKNLEDIELQFMESRNTFQWIYEKIRCLKMDAITDRINFKILCVQALTQIKLNCAKDAFVFQEEALATGTRTKMDKAVKKGRVKLLISLLGDDYLERWEKKHNRPRTCATKYLEMIKAINV